MCMPVHVIFSCTMWIAGDSAMDVEEEGWEVVQRGKKKK